MSRKGLEIEIESSTDVRQLGVVDKRLVLFDDVSRGSDTWRNRPADPGGNSTVHRGSIFDVPASSMSDERL